MKILVLAGGYDQIALIKEIKNYGHLVILADYLDNPPAKKYADKHYQVSTLNEDDIYMIAVRENVDLITTACTDQALLTVSGVSERLGLPCYISYETGLKVTNKKYMKQKLWDEGIPTARYCILEESLLTEDTSYIEKAENSIGFPAVVKPCDCNSSKGVVKVFDNKQLIFAISNAFQLSRSKSVIVEEFLPGIEVSIDAWIDQEGIKILAISSTKKTGTSENIFTICKSQYPVHISEQVKTKIHHIAESISKAFTLRHCPLLIQAIVSNNDVYIIEFSARMGGGTKYKLIEYVSNVDIIKTYVKRILGNMEQIVRPQKSDKYIEINYIYAHNGTIAKLINFEELKSKKIIEDYFQYKEYGSIITQAATSSDRAAGILLVADNEKELCEKSKCSLDMLDILDLNGSSIMIKNI